jgi:plasmid stabilization system protein ParE
VIVIWTLAAARGIERAYDYIFDFNPQAAMRVAESLRAEGNSLVNFPQRGRPVPGTNMRELVTAYTYIIRYRVERNKVIILRVRHTARRPTTP